MDAPSDTIREPAELQAELADILSVPAGRRANFIPCIVALEGWLLKAGKHFVPTFA